MNDSKLINLLSTFSKNEMKEFEKLAGSPFFNKGRNYLPFLNVVKKFHPKFDDEKLTPEFVFSKLYPAKKFNKQIIWNLTSGMFSLAEEFLVHSSLKKHKFDRDHFLAVEYNYRKLSSLLLKTINGMEGLLDKLGKEDNYFQFKIQLALLKKAYNFQQDAQHWNAEDNLKKGEYTVLYFLKNLSSYLIDMKSSYVYSNTDFESNMPYVFLKNINLVNIINYVKMNKYYYSWIMEMYCCLIMMVVDFSDPKHFFRLKELFVENYEQLMQEERYNWIIWLTNYCIMKIYSGIDFKRYLFEMNELNLKNGIVFLRVKYLSKILFLRILKDAISVNEIEWSKKYIEEYIPKLRPSHQKSLHAFCYAILSFKLKDYDKVLENLAKVEFIDAQDKLFAKTLYLRTYYELNEIETLLLHIDSTRHFVSENSTISDSSKKNYLNSLNVLNKLINLKINNNFEDLDEIQKALQDRKFIDLDEWLFEKIEEIKSKKSFF